MKPISFSQLGAFIVPALFLGTAGIAVLSSFNFPTAHPGMPGPAVAPLLYCSLLGLFGLMLGIQALRRNTVQRKIDFNKLRTLLLLVVSLLVYTIAMPWLGFLVSSVILISISLRLFGYTHWLHGTAVACVVVWLIYVIFALLMKVPLPEGIVG